MIRAMVQRIYGLETEYALGMETRDGSLSPSVPGELFDSLESEILKYCRALRSDSFGRDPAGQERDIEIREGHFLESGARFYYDTGHAEWATPEAATPQQAALYELAGQYCLIEAAKRVVVPQGCRLFMVKNNVDYMRGTTYGCHENYLVKRHGSGQKDTAFFGKLVEQLVPFLVTRQIFCGAGKVGCTDSVARRHVGYQISQRADFIECVTSRETRSERAIINERDESLANAARYRRLHLIVGDSNMSSYANILKLGTTGVVLRLIEEGLKDAPTLDDPVKALHAVSQDLTCHKPLLLGNGNKMNPIEIQRWYLDQTRRFFDADGVEADGATQQVIRLWEEVLEELSVDPMRLADRVDWVTKYHYLMTPALRNAGTTWEEIAAWSYVIERLMKETAGSDDKLQPTQEQYARYQRYVTQHRLNWRDYEIHYRLYFNLRERDLRYHDIDPGRSLFYCLNRERLVSNVFSDAQIRSAQREPPPNTRARIRSEVIHWAHREGLEKCISMDWGRIELSSPRESVLLDDPCNLVYPGIIRALRKRSKQEQNSEPSDTELETMIRILETEDAPPEEKGVMGWIRRKIKSLHF